MTTYIARISRLAGLFGFSDVQTFTYTAIRKAVILTLQADTTISYITYNVYVTIMFGIYVRS